MKDGNPAISLLQPCDEATLERIRRSQPDVPKDYLEFLREVGAGEIGKSQYNVYTGLIDPAEVYGETPPGLQNIALFGDDMQGFCAGFDTVNWKVVEVDPTNMAAVPAANSFEEFIRKRIDLAG